MSEALGPSVRCGFTFLCIPQVSVLLAAFRMRKHVADFGAGIVTRNNLQTLINGDT